MIIPPSFPSKGGGLANAALPSTTTFKKLRAFSPPLAGAEGWTLPLWRGLGGGKKISRQGLSLGRNEVETGMAACRRYATIIGRIPMECLCCGTFFFYRAIHSYGMLRYANNHKNHQNHTKITV